MPLYMDIHTAMPDGTTAEDVAAAHAVHREAHGAVADEIYPVVQG